MPAHHIIIMMLKDTGDDVRNPGSGCYLKVAEKDCERSKVVDSTTWHSVSHGLFSLGDFPGACAHAFPYIGVLSCENVRLRHPGCHIYLLGYFGPKHGLDV